MLKATAQSPVRAAARLLIGLLGLFAVVDAIGAGSIVAIVLLPFLYWALVTARTTVTRVLLALVSGVCFALALSVLLWLIGFRADAMSWVAVALGGGATVALMKWAPRNV